MFCSVSKLMQVQIRDRKNTIPSFPIEFIFSLYFTVSFGVFLSEIYQK